MASLSDIVSISITTQSAQVRQAGFGVPLIVGCMPRFAEAVRSYSDTDGMIADGFLSTDPEVVAAGKLIAQNPRPSTFKIGRRALLPTPVCKITPTAINSRIYRVILDGQVVDFASDATATAAEITAGLKTAIDAKAPAAWAGSTGYIAGDKRKNSAGYIYVCTATGTSASSGGPTGTGGAITDGTCTWRFAGVVPTVVDGTSYITATSPAAGLSFDLAVDDDPTTAGHAGMAVEWTHADPGIATDLDTIKAADGDFYGLTLTTCGSAEVKAAAAWAETQKKLYAQAVPETQSATVAVASGTDVAATVKASNHFRTHVMFHRLPGEHAGAALLGRCLPYVPGSETWKFKTLAGITTDRLTATHLTNLRNRNAGFFVDFGGVSITAEGKTAAGEWIDVIRGRDWMEERLRVRIYTVLLNNAKVPFTDSGIAAIEAEVRAQLEEGITVGFLSSSPAPTISVPRAAAVSAVDKAARSLTGITFTATIAGAVHAVTLRGTLSV